MYFVFLLNIYLVWSVSALTKLSGSDDKTQGNPGIHFDDVLEDDHGDFELSDIITISKISTGVAWTPTPADRKKSVELHNVLRRNDTHPFPEQSDIPMLEYNNTLEWTAMEFARKCIYEHEFAENDNMTTEEGQCIYQGPTFDAHRAIYRFYHVEYPHYWFNNHTCNKKAISFGCFHMVQIMLSRTEQLGYSAVDNCWPRRTLYMVFFHYIPGKIDSSGTTIHWKYGPTCTRCQPGYHCAGKLCIPQPERFCKAYNLDCECVLKCHNCVKPDWKNCKCNTCKLGWDWPDCSYPCQDRDDFILKDNMCKDPRVLYMCELKRGQGQKSWDGFCYREHGCRATCKMCPLVTPKAKPNQLCCGGKICEEFYALDTKTCECQLLCPSQACMYYTNTTTTVAPKILLNATSPEIEIWQKPTSKQEDRPISLASMTFSRLKMLLIPFFFLLIS